MNGNMIPEGWKENFRMSERSFYILCEKLRPYIQKQTTRFSKLISVEKQVASTLYYVSDEGRLRKVANASGICKSTTSGIIRRVTQAISKFLPTKYIRVLSTEEDVNNLVKDFYEQHGFPQCLGAIDGTHIRIKQPSCSAHSDYINRKGNFTINCQAAADYRYCFFDVVVKWPSCVHNAQIFSNSSLNLLLRDKISPPCPRVIVENEPSVPICLLGDPAYPLLPFIMKEFANGGRTPEEQFFGYRFFSARMVIECAFARLKARFGCLRWGMDINIDDLPYVIHSCFVLHNFCEINKEVINPSYVEVANKFDLEFQPSTFTGYSVNNNELHGKKIRNVYVKYFNQ